MLESTGHSTALSVITYMGAASEKMVQIQVRVDQVAIELREHKIVYQLYITRKIKIV